MGYASNTSFAGPFEIDSEVLVRDALVREANDGDRMSDLNARQFIENNKLKIFGLQSKFFMELREKLSQLGA